MKTFTEMESACENAFLKAGRCWHLCTNGKCASIIFRDEEDYSFGMTLMARCAALFPDIMILSFVLMSNHIHVALGGVDSEERVSEFFEAFRRRLERYCNSKYGKNVCEGFTTSCIPIEDLRNARNVIAYIHRNGYVACRDYTPFSYPWGTGAYMFNTLPLAVESFDKAPLARKRSICRSREEFPSEGSLIIGNYIVPTSFCVIELAMNLFRNAAHYFSMVSKNVEANEEIARSIGDNIYLTDDEMYPAVMNMIRSAYGVNTPNELNVNDKMGLARKMHNEMGATNHQIRRILGLEIDIVNGMFPLTAK